METTGTILLTLGAILFLGFATDELGRRTRLPRVTLLLLFGLLIGPSAADLLPEISYQWLPLVTEMAFQNLVMNHWIITRFWNSLI